MHPSIEAKLKFFTYEHLPPQLQEVSRPFCELAHSFAEIGKGPEATIALTKLLEAKDAAVRSVLS